MSAAPLDQADGTEVEPDPQVLIYLTALRDARTGERSAAGNLAWTGGSTVLKQVIQFLSSIVLARLLSPSDYGLTAIVWSVTAFASLFADIGLSASVVQAKHVTERLLSTAFVLNVAASATLAMLLIAASFGISAFYDQPALTALLSISALNFLLGVTAVPNAVLERLGMFDVLARVEFTAALLGVVVTTAMAALGAGVYSLVVGPLFGTLYASVRLLTFCRWRPRARPTREAAHQLWHFGSGLAAFSFLAYWSRNIDNLLLGRFVSSTQLGFYSRAYNLMMLPVLQVAGVLGRVLFPMLARHQDDVPQLRASWMRATRLAVAATTPIAIGLAVAAPDFVSALYGARWEGMVTILVLLSLAAPPQILAATFPAVYVSLGRTRLLARRGVLTAAIMIIGLVAGLPWGAEGASVGLIVAVVLVVPVLLAPIQRMLDVSAREVVRDVAGTVVAACALAAAVELLRWAVDAPSGVMLALDVAVGGAAYVLVLWLADRRTTMELAAPAIGLLRRLRGT